MSRIRQTKNGTLVFNPLDRYLGRCLDLHSVFSPEEAKFLREMIMTPRDVRTMNDVPVVVEVGANIGSLTVPMAMTGAKVYAFEPQRLIFQMLCANLVLNGLPNVYAYQQAVGAVAGEITVPNLDPDIVQSFGSLSLDMDQEVVGDPVELTTIDHLCLTSCNLIKADVEGMERDVLLGARWTIQHFLPVLYLENDRIDRSEELIDLIFTLGYRAYWHLPLLAPGAQDEFGSMLSINMVCVPNKWKMVPFGLTEITTPKDRPPHERRIEMSEANYKPSGELQGDTKAMPDRHTKTGVTDTYGADVACDAKNRMGGMRGATKSDPAEQCKAGTEGLKQ